MSFRFQFGASRYIPGLSWTSEKNLSSFEFSRSFCFQFRACRYIIGLNRTSKLKVIAVCICYEHPFSISSVSIYYGTQSDIGVKSSCGLHLLRASVFNFEHLDILRDSIGHPSKELLSFEFAKSLYSEFRSSRYSTGLHRNPSKKLLWFEFPTTITFNSNIRLSPVI